MQENPGHYSSIKATEIYLNTDLMEQKSIYRQYFPLSNGKKEGDRRRYKPYGAIRTNVLIRTPAGIAIFIPGQIRQRSNHLST